MNHEARIQELESEVSSLHNVNTIMLKTIEELILSVKSIKNEPRCTCIHQTSHHPPEKTDQGT
jgi:hypothetical protein